MDYQTINGMTAEDVCILNGLLPLAEEARKAEEVIRAAYLFHIGEDIIEVWRDDYNSEFITHDGTWQARYLHQTYDVRCTAEEIFKYLKADFLIVNGFANESINGHMTKEGEMAQIYKYFKGFIKRAADKVK